jgi:hypothetical protein
MATEIRRNPKAATWLFMKIERMRLGMGGFILLMLWLMRRGLGGVE